MKTVFEFWLRVRYSIYSPLYDLLVGTFFMRQRKRSIELAGLKKGDRILIVGAGTGLDLTFLSKDYGITAVDIAPGMLNKLRRRSRRLGLDVDIQVMDARDLNFPNRSFDLILLHMIIAVVPDYKLVMEEVQRVIKPGGVVMIFDKLLPKGSDVSLFRKLINPLAILIASDLNRRCSDIIEGTSFVKVADENAGWGGLLRIIKLVKRQD